MTVEVQFRAVDLPEEDMSGFLDTVVRRVRMVARDTHELFLRYCDRLEATAYNCEIAVARPSLCLYLRGGRVAGRYVQTTGKGERRVFRKHEVMISVPYAVGWASCLAPLVAHEVAHAYQRQFDGSEDQRWHGDLWKFLVRRLGHDPQRLHTYNVERARRIGEALMMVLPNKNGVYKRWSASGKPTVATEGD